MPAETTVRHLETDRLIRVRCERGLWTATLMGPDGVAPSYGSQPAAEIGPALEQVAEFVRWMQMAAPDEQMSRAWVGLVEPAVTP